MPNGPAPFVEQYAQLARYNRWMNGKLYELAASLTDEERKRPMKAFFGSIHGTFNHILLADKVWLGRFGAAEPRVVTSLAEELYSNFEELRAERAKIDETITEYVASLDEARLVAPLVYTSRGATSSHPLWYALTHFFNHQTHHRGQATTLFMQLGHDPGSTDAIALFRGDVPPRVMARDGLVIRA